MMKMSGWRALMGVALIAAATAAPVAHATSVNFEDVSPDTLFSGSSITSGDFTLTSTGNGFSGVGPAATFSIFGNAPSNAADQFLFMLNADGMLLSRTDGTLFFLTSFDASFLAPFGGIGAGVLSGELFVVGVTASGATVSEVFEFGPSDDDGNFGFKTYTTGALQAQALSVVAFTACIYDTNGCSLTGSTVAPQFALDNIGIPEPASVLLAVAALGVAGVARRRRAA